MVMKSKTRKRLVSLLSVLAITVIGSLSALASVSSQRNISYNYRKGMLIYPMVGVQKDVSVDWDLGTLTGGYIKAARNSGHNLHCEVQTGPTLQPASVNAANPRKVIANMTVQNNATGEQLYNYAASKDNTVSVTNSFFTDYDKKVAVFSGHEVRYTTANIEYASIVH